MTTTKILLCASAIGVACAMPANAAELVLIVNAAVGTLSKEQVSDLYLGKSVTFTPYDHAEGSPIYTEFYKKATGREMAQVKATWSRIVFSGKGVPPKQLGDSVAVRKAVAADPKGVGYIEKAAADSSVKVVMPLE